MYANVTKHPFFCCQILQQSRLTLIQISGNIIKMGLIYEMCNKCIGDLAIKCSTYLSS